MIKLVTFSYRDDTPPQFGAAVIDCRSLRNPWVNYELRYLDGRNESVQAYVRATPGFQVWYDRLEEYIVGARVVWLGCHGGKHRSVAVAEILREELTRQGAVVEVQHRALDSR